MKVLPQVMIDARMVGPIPHGIARYVTLLAEGLGGRELSYEPVFLVDPRLWTQPDFAGFRTIPVQAPFLDVPREWWQVRAALRGAALFHSPSFASFPLCPVPWVVTVHDLNHLQYGSWAKKFYYRTFLKTFIRRAAAVTTVSQFSERELREWLGYKVQITVVENALDPRFAGPSRPAEREKGYFLCVANDKPHKRVKFLIDVYEVYRAICGKDALPLVTTVAGPGAAGVERIGGVGNEELRSLLAGARAGFFPAAYEGFGLPPLEAAVEGCPVFVSDIPSHREALRFFGGQGVTWLPVDDSAAWASAFEKAHRGDLESSLPEERALAFSTLSPARLAADMDQIYRRVLRLPS